MLEILLHMLEILNLSISYLMNQNQNQMAFPQGFMECKICLRKFSGKVANRTPRILANCGHTICQACCVRIKDDDGRIVCPFDRKETDLIDDETVASFLDKNYYILEMLEILKDVFPDTEEPGDAKFDIEEGMHTARELTDFAEDSEEDEDDDDLSSRPRSHYASSILNDSEYLYDRVL